LYLQGNKYPDNVETTYFGCSIETDCYATVSVLLMHVKFDSSGGDCKQSVTISDESGDLYTIKCSDNSENNDYNLKTIAISVYNYLYIIYTSTSVDTRQFWIGFSSKF